MTDERRWKSAGEPRVGCWLESPDGETAICVRVFDTDPVEPFLVAKIKNREDLTEFWYVPLTKVKRSHFECEGPLQMMTAQDHVNSFVNKPVIEFDLTVLTKVILETRSLTGESLTFETTLAATPREGDSVSWNDGWAAETVRSVIISKDVVRVRFRNLVTPEQADGMRKLGWK